MQEVGNADFLHHQFQRPDRDSREAEKALRIKEGTTIVFQEDHGRLVLEPNNYAAIYALQCSLAELPLEEELAKERERENTAFVTSGICI
jgi:hypothetical protein